VTEALLQVQDGKKTAKNYQEKEPVGEKWFRNVCRVFEEKKNTTGFGLKKTNLRKGHTEERNTRGSGYQLKLHLFKDDNRTTRTLAAFLLIKRTSR